MKRSKFILFLMFVALFAASAFSQDVVYVANKNGSGSIEKISANPTTGSTGSSSFSEIGNINNESAAIGYFGSYLFYLDYGGDGTGEGNGSVRIRSIKNNGTDHHNCGNFDVNGSSDRDLGFVRLAIDKTGTGWILARRMTSSTMYLAKFTANGVNGNVTAFTVVCSNITTSDNSNMLFENGDICFDGNGRMYALANNTNGLTKVYTILPNSSTVLQYKWLLKTSANVNFSGQVSGVGFSSTGSLYFTSTDGLWFLNQFSTNFAGGGTVLVNMVKEATGLADIATQYWPMFTQLPVKITNIQTKLIISTSAK